MFDDDEDRLLIDDHEQGGDCGEKEKEKPSPKTDERVRFTPPTVESSKSPNGLSAVSGVNTSREEGELDDEEMDTSRSPAKPVQEKPAVHSERKRVNGEHTSTTKSTQPSPKKSKIKNEPSKRDQGTCVHPRASQADMDESPFEMEAGSSFVMQMTVVCRLEGANTVFISGKWKDQELSGVLTDGEPPGFFNFAKKRNALSNNSAGSESEKSNMGTPKKRMGRSNDGKKKAAAKVDEDEEELDVTGTAEGRETNGSGGFIKLAEVPPRTSMHICPTEGCEHRYESSAEMEYHIGTTHKTKSLMYENNCSQTEVEEAPKKKMVSVFTDTEGLELPLVKVDMVDRASSAMEPPPSVVKVEGIVKSPSSRFSDISDDAPQLQKEEPQLPVEGYANGVLSRPSTSTPATAAGPSAAANSTPTTQPTVVQPSAVVPPVAASPRAANGLLMPAGLMPGAFMSPFTPVAGNSSIATPSRDQSKLSHLKDPASMAEAVAATHTPVKPISSPAQNRTPFAVPPMVAVSAAQNPMAQHQQQQQQLLQQLQMQQMMYSHPQMRMFSMGGVGPNPAQDQMAQIAAIQQAMQNQGAFMFPKHG